MNGKLDAGPKTITNNPVAGGGRIDVSPNATDNNFNGQIDQVRIFNYARTPAQIAWDYSIGRPYAQWKMDECQGTVINNSISSSYSGTLTIGASGEDTIGTCGTSSTAWGDGASGKRNYSISLDGQDDYIQVSGLLGINTITSITNVSLSAWVNLTAKDTDGAEVISIGDVVNIRADDTSAGCGSTSVLASFQKTAGNWVNLCANKAIAGTGWHHIVYTFDDINDSQNLYLDGVLVATGAETNSILTTGQGSNTFIGKHGNGGTTYDFNGKIDDVQVFSYPLTAAQVKTIYNEGAIRFGPASGAP